MSVPRKPDKRARRRLAMQVLYQLDVAWVEGTPTAEALAQTLDDEHDTPEARQLAADHALAAWAVHEAHDALATELAPDWPTNRQPPVDRAILRLACYEIASGITPPKVAINEAVELAKQFGAENSPSFINGLLDKAAKRLTPGEDTAPSPATGDAWLDDAMRHEE